jgi:hypothetical protein
MLHPTAVVICRTVFFSAELEHAIREMDTTADLATPSPAFTGKCGDDRPATWYRYQVIVLQHAEQLLLQHCCNFMVYQHLSYWDADNLFLTDSIPEKYMSRDVGTVIVDTFQYTDV